MAKPRVFVSSTYYDFKDVRASLKSFVSSMGYEPILNEAGTIPYGSTKTLDEYCYDEVDTADILVAIVGGRFGSTASDNGGSISQKELKTALDNGRQVYIFILRTVLSEYATYKNNKDSEIKWAHVDNAEIFRFIEELFLLPINNAIFPFDSADEITSLLREQWAGLFQRLLNDRITADRAILAQQLNEGLTTLRQVLEMASAKDIGSSEEQEISTTENPIFYEIRNLLKIRHRIFFKTRREMFEILEDSGYVRVDRDNWDNDNVQEWYHRRVRTH